MKKRIVLTLICALLLMPAAWAEEDNEGTVIVIDDWTATEDAAPEASTEEDPFVPDTVDRAVFNADGRVTVFNPAAYPYSAIAYMDIVGTCGDHWSGTGFMVGKNRLLTASHCLVCSDHSAWAKTIDFYFGYKSRRNYLYRYSGRWTAWAGNLFKDRSYTTQNDFGCIRLKKNVGDTTGWLGAYWNRPDSAIESDYLYVAGYRDGMLKYDSGWAKVLDDTHMSYTIDAVAGNSGGPVFTWDNYCVGIHIAESKRFNIGYRLTSAVKRNLDNLK